MNASSERPLGCSHDGPSDSSFFSSSAWSKQTVRVPNMRWSLKKSRSAASSCGAPDTAEGRESSNTMRECAERWRAHEPDIPSVDQKLKCGRDLE